MRDLSLNKNKINEYFNIPEKTPFDEVEKLSKDIKGFRQVFEEFLGNNDLFSNKGFTITKDGSFGLREWILSTAFCTIKKYISFAGESPLTIKESYIIYR